MLNEARQTSSIFQIHKRSLNMAGHFLPRRPILSDSLVNSLFFIMMFNWDSSVLVEHFCGLICRCCSALRGDGSLRQTDCWLTAWHTCCMMSVPQPSQLVFSLTFFFATYNHRKSIKMPQTLQ